MKLNWFSPLPPAKTGIAEYTTYVLSALQNYAEVVLWTNQLDWSSELEQYAKVQHYQLSDLPWSEINQADLNIYHIGNNPIFHDAIWQVSRHCPGLVVLHEFKLQDLFLGIYRHQLNSQELYLAQMAYYYGDAAKQAAKQLWNGQISVEILAEKYPLTPLALENAIGVIIHSKEAFNILSQEKQWAVAHAPLPFLNKRLQNKNKLSQTPHRIIMFGYIGSNRRLDKFLQALSSLPEKNKFQVDIYGEIDKKDYINNTITQFNLGKIVTLHSFVKESELDLALANSHLAINLRYPTMGESSLSQLRIWNHALPSLVTKVGWYADLPENAVAFIRPEPEYEIQDIQQQLQNFLKNPARFVEMGQNGLQILEEKHKPEDYALAIVDFAKKVKDLRLRSVAYNLVERVGEQIGIWSSQYMFESEIEKVAEAIHFITL